ncbi:3-hydroxybutyryl-CoA dehydrogenase [Labrenzia sp. EL_142]|nr:3-hydroxybutyryl-CoA dehydrogenase [Labrenzia sp. EL_142]
MTKIETVAVVGAGTMGTGIALSALRTGLNVILVDASGPALERSLSKMKRFFSRQVEKEKMSADAASLAQERCLFAENLEEVSKAELCIEAVFEDLALKRQVFKDLERAVGPDTTLATNTSALKVREIGAGLVAPERLCGMHFFSPAEVNPIVEVVRGTKTADTTILAVLDYLKSTGKEPIECRDHAGFALNRFFCPYTNEAARCVDDGLGTPAQIDEIAMEEFGVGIGPFAVMNIVKPRINLAAVRNLAELGEFYAPADSLQRLGDADGYWDMSSANAPLDENTVRRIGDRLKGAVFLAVLEELEERVATPEAIDNGARKAFTFARGPVELMHLSGEQEVRRLVELVKPCSCRQAAP